MKTAFIIHGTKWMPQSNWFESLGNELMNKWYIVVIPCFPAPENQNLESWEEKFEEYKRYMNEETIFIAHSVGPSFVLRVLELSHIQVKGCYFVSGFLGNIGISEYDDLNDSFVNRSINWEIVKQKSESFYMCHGDNDPYVPLANALQMSEELWIDIDMIQNGGHLNSESGYTEFPYLLEKITTK